MVHLTFKHLPQDKFPCLFVILFNAYLSFLLLRQLRLFVCYVFSVVSFFCFAIIAPFSCHMLLISTSLALLSFLSIVPCAVSSSLLFFIYYFSVSLSLLLGSCAWFPRIFSSGLLVPTSFLTYFLAFLVFFPFFRCSALFAVEALS